MNSLFRTTLKVADRSIITIATLTSVISSLLAFLFLHNKNLDLGAGIFGLLLLLLSVLTSLTGIVYCVGKLIIQKISNPLLIFAIIDLLILSLGSMILLYTYQFSS